MTDRPILTTCTDPLTRGLDYLYGIRPLALDPDMVDLVYDLERRTPICCWIGEQIEALNAQLNHYLRACQDCFHSWEQPACQIFAVPLAQSLGLDALCNLQTHPISILIDAGRVKPADWSRVVVHEYAHAHAGSPGHHAQFARSLTHLCLGLGIAPPPLQPNSEAILCSYPYCVPTADPLAFWRGEGDPWKSIVGA